MVEVVCSHRSAQQIRDLADSDLAQLRDSVGSFLAYDPIGKTARDLAHNLAVVIELKQERIDPTDTCAEVDRLFRLLVSECETAIRAGLPK